MSKNGKPIPELNEIELKRFWAKVALPDENGCLLWTAVKSGGYGQFGIRRDGKQSMYLAHRISYFLAYGEFDWSMVPRHVVCQNKACVRPDHLELGTIGQNLTDPDGATTKAAQAKWAKTHCKHGHEFTEENTYWQFPPSRPNGKRQCKECTLIRVRESQARKNLGFTA